MIRRFRGESTHKVDQKGRVSVPAPFRRVLEEGDPDWVSGQAPNFVLLYGLPGRPRLEGYSMRAIEDLDDVVSRMPRFHPDREEAERILNSKSVYAQVDEAGRIVLPAKLRDLVGVTDEAVFVGRGDSFLIWSPEGHAADEAAYAARAAEGGDEYNPLAAVERYSAGQSA